MNKCMNGYGISLDDKNIININKKKDRKGCTRGEEQRGIRDTATKTSLKKGVPKTIKPCPGACLRSYPVLLSFETKLGRE